MPMPEFVRTVVFAVLLLVGLPLLLLMLTGFYANSPLAERVAWRAIRRECERLGCTDIEPFTNSRASFGVWYRKDGRKLRGKCGVSLFRGRVTWEKNDPSAL
jgi:hypothetical protein